MTQESYSYLAKNVLAGFVQTRPPWWKKYAEAEGHSLNTWDGAIPIEAVEGLMCSWEPLVESIFTQDMEPVGTHKLIRHSQTKAQLGLVGIDAATHTFREWLVGTIKECVSPDELEVSSAGLLRRGAQGWVQIERPETAVGPDGIKFSPSVTFSTSLDGSLASMINQNTTHTICDNTMRLTRGQGVAFKHTSRSPSKLGTYRGVATAIMQGESDFKAVLERLLAEEVSDNAFSKFLTAFVPINDDDAPAKRTRSERKRQDITQLYRTDPRVASWKGTAFGVVQAVNTYDQHLSQLRNATGIELSDTDLRAMRNYSQRLAPVRGETRDERTIRLLEAQLDSGHATKFATV